MATDPHMTPEPPKQMPLDLAPHPSLSREDFIEGNANRAALRLVEAWPEWKSPLSIVYGPEGSGKSHLAKIWAEKAGAKLISINELSGLDPVVPCLIEDAGSQDLDETALFHALNQIRQAGGTMLMTTRTPPSAWAIELPDLKSRLSAAALTEIEAPDDGLLAAVLAKLFADRQVAVEANVVSYLVNRMERSLSAAVSIVDQLDKLSLERQSRISRALAALVVKDSDPRQSELDI
jgi:chromosomal replication initiation ATPase DnaA